MNFRECRLRAIHDIFKILDESISIEKTFLLLGGMKNAVYYFNGRGIKILGLSGCGEINSPGVFDLFEISYDKIISSCFLEEYYTSNNRFENIYVIPALREMLNTESIDLKNLVLVGHSFFIVDSIKENKIYFKTIGDNTDYYMHLDVFGQITNTKEWIMEADFEVYKININKLKDNEFLRLQMRESEEKLLQNNIKTYLVNTQMVGDEGTIRFEGEQSYTYVINHLNAMKKKLLAIKGTSEYDKFIKYVYIQMANFRKYIASGSDGYYRTEFCDILSKILPSTLHREYWENVVGAWRNLGRTLVQVTSMKYLENNAVQGLEELVRQWDKIKQLEIEGIKKLETDLSALV